MSESDAIIRPVILIVDDDADIRVAIRDVLIEEGFDVQVAENGERGLELLRACRPSLVLLDLMMPVLNGHQFLERRAVDPALAAVPVVVMTAGRGEAKNVAAILRKPMKLAELLEAVHAFCMKRAA